MKPNDQLVPAKFNYVRIAEQLRNAGVLEVVRVARAGFPVRLGVFEWLSRVVFEPLNKILQVRCSDYRQQLKFRTAREVIRNEK